MQAVVIASTLSLSGVLGIWALWLSGQAGASRVWKLLTVAIIPCVATPLVLSGVLAEATLSDIANGALLVFAVLVSLGTLLHAVREQRLEGSD